MTREMEIKILFEDLRSDYDVNRYIKENRYCIFEDLEEHFDDYMYEWDFDEDEIAEFREFVFGDSRYADWSKVEIDGKKYFIQYCL